MNHFDIEERQVFDKDYLNIALKNVEECNNVKIILEKLQSVRKVNITINSNIELTVYPSRVYSIKETRKEVEMILGNYFNGSKLDPLFETENISQISEKGYADILKHITKYGKQLEKFKDLYSKFDEEGFRCFFLPYLNSISSNHRATGETFNKIGKTDILIQDSEGINVFIAECKIWKGETALENAINQLLDRYVTWRDEKVAIIIFNKNMANFSELIEKAKNKVSNHKNFEQFIGQRDETSFSYIFHHPDDINKKINLELILFNCT